MYLPYYDNIVIIMYIIINTLILLVCLSVCLSVCDGCGRGHNKFAGRVQNYCVRSSCHRNFLEIVKASLVPRLPAFLALSQRDC